MKKLLICIFFLCVLPFNGFAQESPARVSSLQNELELLKIDAPGLDETININISQTTLSNFLLAISKVHSINISISPELDGISIVNNFSNVKVADVLVFLIKEYSLDIDFTGNILSIKKYIPPIEEIAEKEVNVKFGYERNAFSFDLKNDPLEKVFRAIMGVSNVNVLFTPEIANKPLTLYLKEVPIDIALSKLAETNNLVMNKSRDGFYLFDSAIIASEDPNKIGRKRRRTVTNFYYKILDTINKKVEVSLQDTPISDVIYTLGADLKIDIFTASPLENAGTATVDAKEIDFDTLLTKIFESSSKSISNSEPNPSARNNNQVPESSTNFTYKKDRNMYFFGTEDQLSLKQIEVVQMMHRSIQLLENPSGSGQRRRGSNVGSFNNGLGNGINSFGTPGTNQNTGFNNSPTRNSSTNNPNILSIEDIIPDDIKDGLDIKIDKELNSFIVSGGGAKVERFKEFVNYIDKKVPVILFEIMILEVSRSAIVETGVSFGLGEKPSGKTIGSVFPDADVRVGAVDVNKIIGNFNGFGSLNIGKVVPEFYLDIKAMESSGDIKVKSTPKLTTINSHKAYLSSGETSYYAITQQNFIGTQNPINSEITNFVPIDAELAIEIMPFVSGDGQITLDIQVIQSAFNGTRISEDAPPGVDTREFSSIIRMQDQDVAILGGIEEARKDDSRRGVPILARIPGLGWLFGKKRREDSKRTLSILIKPTIID